MHSEITLIFILLIVYQLKHFLCDFPLQFKFMIVGKCDPSWKFFIPLLAHASMHAMFTLLIIIAIQPSLWYFAIVDLVVHFTLDRIKSGPRYLGRFNNAQKSSFWSVLGFDQALHHITHMIFIYYTVLSS